MTAPRWALWILWAVFAALLALELRVAYVIPPRPHPWYEAQVAVAGFVLALLSVLAAVGTFTLRETLAMRQIRRGELDPSTEAGFARVRGMLVVLWTLCLVVGLLGDLLAWGAARPRAAWPYFLGAAALLVLHAPRRWLFSVAQDESQR
jgi:hypothetical protein